MIDALTDNKNRSAAEMRKMFENSNGNLAGAGAVGFMFQRKGLIVIPVAAAGEDQMMNDVLESGAENMETAGENYYITCAVPDFENVKKALAKKYKLVTSEIAMIPKDSVKVDEETGRKIMNLMENLDDSEDVQKIYHNFILPESLLGK
jgi:transcriptional/translational regulatory protein YebC/TACO1